MANYDMNVNVMDDDMDVDVMINSEEMIYVKDVLSIARKKSVKGLELRFNDLMKQGGKFTKEQLAVFERFADPKYLDLRNAVRQARYIYHDIVAAYINTPEEDETRDDEFRENVEFISDMVRRILEKLDPSDRAGLAKYESMNSKKGIREDGGSNFAATVLAFEYLYLVASKWAQIDFAGERLIVLDDDACIDGAEIEFEDGVSEVAVVNNPKPLTGRFVIREFKGEFYATKPISELVVVPAPGTKMAVRLSPKSNNTDKLVAVLDKVEKAVLTANPKEGDFLMILNKDNTETKLVKIDMIAGNRALSKLYNGAVVKIRKTVVAEAKTEGGAVKRSVILLLEEVDRMNRRAEVKDSSALQQTYTEDEMVFESEDFSL